MAVYNIVVGNGIHAEIANGNINSFSNLPIIIDPLSLSYSGLGVLCFYDLVIDNIVGLTEVNLLKNGKNSRFSAIGPGSCDLTLTVKDDVGNEDTDTITINII